MALARLPATSVVGINIWVCGDRRTEGSPRGPDTHGGGVAVLGGEKGDHYNPQV